MMRRGHSVPIRAHRQNNANAECGFILMTVMLLITLVAAVLFLLTRENASSLAVGASEVETASALYVAEAGIEHAIWRTSQADCSGYTDMPNQPFGDHSYTVVVSPEEGSPVTVTATGTLSTGATRTLVKERVPVYGSMTVTTLQPDAAAGQDTHIKKDQSDRNYGADEELRIGFKRRSLLRFDLATLPAGARISAAVLELKSLNIANGGYVDVHRITNGWVEGSDIGSSGSGATWDERAAGEPWIVAGGDYDPAVSATSFVGDASGDWHRWDITALVGAWLSEGETNNGLILVAQPGFDDGRFHSSDDLDASVHPRLIVSYACECGVDCAAAEAGGNYCEADFEAEVKNFDFGWMPGTNELTGIDFLPQGTIVNGVTIPVGGGWITADPGADDFFVTDSAGATLTSFPVGQSDVRGVAYVEGGTWSGHLAFADKSDDAIYFMDLDGAIQGSVSTSLIADEPFGLSFIGETDSGIYDGNIAFTSKKTGGGAVYIIDQAGALRKRIDIDSYAPDPQGVAHVAGADKLIVVDVKGLISIVDFDGGLLNQYLGETWGFEDMRGVTIHPDTCEHVVIDKHLTTVAGLIPSDVGIGRPRLLMVVANENDLTAQEEAKKTLIESWGYATTVIDDSSSGPQYDAAVADNDVVFIGEDVTSGQVNTKLVDAPIGIVTEEANLTDEFGLSATVDWSIASVLDIGDSGHYITLPFPTGPMQLLAAASSVAHHSGSRSPDLRVLGSTVEGPALAVLEAGDEMIDTSAAAGRRVQLPWGDSNFDLANLTTDGNVIFKRSLKWAAQPAPRCDADYVATNVASDFPWMPGTGEIHGIDYLPEGLVVNSVTVPAGGGWVMNDPNQDRLFVADLAGNALTDFQILPKDTQGVVLIDAGPWFHHLAVADKDKDRVYFLDLEGSIRGSFSLAGITNNPLGLGFIGATIGAIYDSYLAISSDKNPAGGGTATVYIVDQGGSMHKAIDVEAFAPTPLGIAHVDGADKLIIVDKTGTISVIDFDGRLLHQYFGVDFGLTEVNEIAINPSNCDHVVVEKQEFKKIVSLDRDTESGGVGYFDMYLPRSAATPDTWESTNLGIYGVPPNSVAEVALVNSDGGNALWGGVRTAGSGLERRLQLHEASGGGVDAATMHVQTDSAGFVELYSGDPDKLSFLILGYWTGVTYVENWTAFKAGAGGQWKDHALDSYGVPPGAVAEIMLLNQAGFDERQAGARTNGSSLTRIVALHEAGDGGTDSMSMMAVAGTDSSATIEVYAGDDADIDFYLLGYWSVPPGTYNGTFSDLGSAAVKEVWEDRDLNPEGVPGDAVVQIVVANRDESNKTQLGARSKGFHLAPLIELHEASGGGDDVVTKHVKADGDGVIQWYDDDIVRDHRFYLLGWWNLD